MAQRKAEATGSAPPRAGFLTKSDLAREHIQELILSGTVRAGQRITTREISEAIGVSETPIREAIRLLAAEGWLVLSAHHGVVVASVNAEQLAEVYAIRGALGALAIERGGAGYSPRQLDALDRNLAESEVAVTGADVARYVRLNREFHQLLSDTPKTQWILRLLDNLWAQTAAVGRGFEVVPGRIRTSLAEHREIRAAIGRKNYTQAASLMADHERIAGEALIDGLARR